LKGFQRASIPVAARHWWNAGSAVLYSLFNSGLDSASGTGNSYGNGYLHLQLELFLFWKKSFRRRKILITAIAVVDDLGAVIVIALFILHRSVFLSGSRRTDNCTVILLQL
jgi:NhaA family Na+:H+ antiporter